MTWALERDEVEELPSTTRLVFKSLFFPSATPRAPKGACNQKNEAATQTFLHSLASRKVTAGFQCLLQNTFNDGAASAIASYDPSQELDPHYAWKLNTLCRAFGTLLKSTAVEVSASNKSTTVNSASTVKPRQRRSPGHLGIAPLEPALWTNLTVAEDLQDVLGNHRESGEAQENTFPCVYNIVHNQMVWNGQRSPLRGFWGNEDGARVEIHPDTLGTIAPDDKTCGSNEAGDEAERSGTHNHHVMSQGYEGAQESFQPPWTPEETDGAYTGSFSDQITW